MALTPEMHYLTVLEAGCPRPRLWQGSFLWRAMRKDLGQASALSPDGLLALFGIPWLIGALPQSLPSSSHGDLPVCATQCPNFPPFKAQ